MAWFKRTGDARLGCCATDGCGQTPIWRLEADGVGSNYCSACKEKITGNLLSPTLRLARGFAEYHEHDESAY